MPPPEGAAGPAADKADAPKKGAGAAAGYAYADKAASTSHAHHGRYRRSGPVVQMPGFEQTPDGGSRLFVQLSQNVPVEERKAQGSITYVLKGASPRVWNNTNALVTVHFNTPVSRARLVPQGADLLFIIDLRAAATPTWKMAETQDKSAVLQVDFPKGDFLSNVPVEPAATSDDEGASRPAPPAGGRRKKRGPAPPPPAKKH